MAPDALDPLDHSLTLRPEEVDFLASVARRAYQCVLNHEVLYLRTGRNARTPRKLHVASFAFKLPYPLDSVRQFSSHTRRPPTYDLVVFPDASGLWAAKLTEHVGAFLQECQEQDVPARFAVLNELSHSFDTRQTLGSSWAELARRYGIYIVPGTYHCVDEFFGVAPIYGPNPDRNTNILKQNAALRQGERIRTPDARELFICDTDFGNMIVWICLDIYDPGLVLKFLNVTNRFAGTRDERRKPNREILLVLVPSYSWDTPENIQSCIQSISRFSRTAIVCANSYVADKGDARLECYAFCGGEPLVPILYREYPKDGSGELECKAWLYEVDVESLRELQAQNYSSGEDIFSSPFAAIVHGGGYRFREI